jgi:hypothetical protein
VNVNLPYWRTWNVSCCLNDITRRVMPPHSKDIPDGKSGERRYIVSLLEATDSPCLPNYKVRQGSRGRKIECPSGLGEPCVFSRAASKGSQTPCAGVSEEGSAGPKCPETVVKSSVYVGSARALPNRKCAVVCAD